MAQNYHDITAAYREADFNERLNMYLQYPQLRSNFILIDRNDLEAELAAGLKSRPKIRLAPISIILSPVAAFAKKIFGMASA